MNNLYGTRPVGLLSYRRVSSELTENEAPPTSKLVCVISCVQWLDPAPNSGTESRQAATKRLLATKAYLITF